MEEFFERLKIKIGQKEYLDKTYVENMMTNKTLVQFWEFVNLIYNQENNLRFINDLSAKIIQVATKYDIIIDDKKCLEWIRQAQEIENYSAEQIEDLKIAESIKRKDRTIEYLEQENHNLRKQLVNIKQIIDNQGEII